jgi:hypothetical protein
MADKDYNKQAGPEKNPEAPKAAPEQKPEGKEIKEATISVGIEAGEIIGETEAGSGEISESERTKKEGYAGGGAGAGIYSQGSRKLKYPSVEKMSHQVEKELNKEMKFLNKKIKRIVKERDANSLNSLVARLRELQRILSKLANATADIIKDLWISYVKDKNN